MFLTNRIPIRYILYFWELHPVFRRKPHTFYDRRIPTGLMFELLTHPVGDGTMMPKTIRAISGDKSLRSATGCVSNSNLWPGSYARGTRESTCLHFVSRCFKPMGSQYVTSCISGNCILYFEENPILPETDEFQFV